MDIQDEGYTGSDTQSQPSFDEMMIIPDSDDVKAAIGMKYAQLMEAVLCLPLEQRMHFVKDLCHSFPTTKLIEIHSTISGMVYFDPVAYLPPELILDVLSHLTPKDLLTASLVSRPWRQRTQDERLWHDCFGREGWILDRSRMSKEEDMAKKRGSNIAENLMRGTRPLLALQRRSSRKRPREEANLSENESTVVNAGEEPAEELSDGTEGMQGLQATASSVSAIGASESTLPGVTTTEQDASMNSNGTASSTEPDVAIGRPSAADVTQVQIQPPVFSSAKEPKISWPYLYKQRRRLERNWENGKFQMFQLPDPAHMYEGHAECVYTIQHSGNHLVSGSRDKTIRVWDLNSYRLKFPPLKGHSASVLCLQFDDRPGDGHDIIISGGSDKNVIVWRFSTGSIIKKIDRAHDESVLNLRFDDRYLVTCSKDKSIKIWNRHEINHNDPIIPRYVLNKFETNIPGGLKLEPFTLLATMTGHQAAVNAVQISGDIVVSASGDRTIKSWNIHSGTFKKSYQGHSKGIACVQFDGRRIVSGSSDNSVRIFDFETTAEVACLDGHNHLVRTVQARFGDLETISDEELLEESRQADEGFLRALDAGMTPAQGPRLRRRRNPGSSRPEDMLSYGTRVPPGGGGSKWSKIVSGSYDETVIVWKRGNDGKWIQSLRLHQGVPSSQSGAANRARAVAPPQPTNPNHANAQAGQQHMNASQQAQVLLQQAQSQLLQVNTILQQPPLGHTEALLDAQVAAISAAQNDIGVRMQALASQHGTTAAQTDVPSSTNHATGSVMNNQHQQTQPQQDNANVPQNAQATQPAQGGHAQAQGAQPQGLQVPSGQHHHHHHHHVHHHHAAQQAAAQRENNRVFKLQFDARRIIACSQNKVIVGWDFANGDKDLEWIGDWSVETA